MDASLDGSVINLPERLDSSAARDLYTQIDAEKGNDLHLNATDVSHVGGLCLQVLIAAREEWARENKSLHIHSASDALSTFLNAIGQSDLLKSEAACP